MFYICVRRGKDSQLHTLTFKSFQGISHAVFVLHNTEQSAWRPLKACLNSLINFVAPKRPTTLVAHMPGYKHPRPCPLCLMPPTWYWPLTRTAYVPLWSVQLKSVWWRCSSQRRCGCLGSRAGDEYIGDFTLEREYIVGKFHIQFDKAITKCGK